MAFCYLYGIRSISVCNHCTPDTVKVKCIHEQSTIESFQGMLLFINNFSTMLCFLFVIIYTCTAANAEVSPLGATVGGALGPVFLLLVVLVVVVLILAIFGYRLRMGKK